MSGLPPGREALVKPTAQDITITVAESVETLPLTGCYALPMRPVVTRSLPGSQRRAERG